MAQIWRNYHAALHALIWRLDGVSKMASKGFWVALCVTGVCLTQAVHAEDFNLPPEVTPQLRAACESDVRRLCIGANPTVAKAKGCVSAKFSQLGNRCKLQIAMAGLKP